MSSSIEIAERMVNKLTKLMAVKITRLESVKRLMLSDDTTREEFIQLSGIKYDLKREIAKLEVQIDEHAQEADLHRMLPFRIETTVQAIQETHGLNGLTKEQVILQVLEEKMGWL